MENMCKKMDEFIKYMQDNPKRFVVAYSNISEKYYKENFPDAIIYRVYPEQPQFASNETWTITMEDVDGSYKNN